MIIKQTPGPWRAVYVGCSDWDLSGPVTEQDWRLAAAAPDLLEALKAIIGDQPEDKYGYFAAHNAMNDDKRQAARAAIAKATGGQP